MSTQSLDINIRRNELMDQILLEDRQKIDRMFVAIMIAQWLGGIAVALWVAPSTWIGEQELVHFHVWVAIGLGFLISCAPVLMGIYFPGAVVTRHVIAIAQALWGALLIHLSGGRIETHFHVFGSLAFIAFYRDWKVLVTMTLVVSADHAIRGIFFPISVYGIALESPFRWLEHAAWIVFEDIILFYGCARGLSEVKAVCDYQANLEDTNSKIEETVRLRSSELEDTKNFFQSVLDSIQAHICVLDSDGTIVETNAFWDQFAMQNGGGEIGVGANYLEVCRGVEGDCEGGANSVADGIEEVIKGRRSDFVSEYECHTETENHWYQVNVTPLNKHLRGAAVVAHSEITERVLAENELVEKSQHLNMLSKVAKYTDNAVVITDAKGCIEWVNEGFERITEYSFEEVIGKTGSKFLRGRQTSREALRFIREQIGRQQGFDVELIYYTKSKKAIWMSIEVRPIRDESNEVAQFITIIRDVSDKREREEHLRLLRQVVDLSHDSMFIIGPDSQFQDINEAAHNSLGYSKDELLGLSVSDINPEMSRELWPQHWADVKNKEIKLVETYHVRKDGSEFPVEISPIYVQKDNHEYICAFARDISKRKQDEDERERLHRELDAQLTAIDRSQARIEFDRLGTVIDVNQNFLDIVGYQRDELIGENHQFLLGTENENEAEFDEFWAPLIAGRARSGVFVRLGTKGSLHWLYVNYNPVFGADGSVEKVVKYATDITSQRLAEAEKQKLAEELHVAARHAGMAEVATGVLHNVGNVLTSVNVSANLLSELTHKLPVSHLVRASEIIEQNSGNIGEFLTHDAKGKHFPNLLKEMANSFERFQDTQTQEIESLIKNIEHIKEIVAMQQSFAKKSGITELVDLDELIDDAIRINNASLSRHNVEIIREQSEVPLIQTHKHDVIQILINLVKNAKQAVESAGKATKQIILSTSAQDGFAEVSVTDNGIGIPKENLKKIFQHGFTTKTTGHGFGLHSCGNAAQEMGGSLTVHSEGEGLGATFTLKLPLELKRKNEPIPKICNGNAFPAATLQPPRQLDY